MTQRALKLGLGLLALVTAANASPVAAAEEVPFSAELSAVFVGPDEEGALFALKGNATQMGPVTGIARNEARGPRELGVFFLEAANGDRLFCSYEFEVGPPLGDGTYTIESGTGRFEGASGGGVITVDGSPGDFFIVTLDGNLSF